MSALANTGAVLLPYSYTAGTGATQTSSGVAFTMTGYTPGDTKQPIAVSINALDSELRSLRAVWPSTPIVLVGHSYGGLVAEEWWEQAWGAGDHGGVTHVFSLDSPINGVFQCTGSIVYAGSDVSGEFCRRRASLTGDRGIDANIIRLAADGSYTAVGNVDDPTYRSVIPPSGGGGIEDQVIYKCGDRGDTNIACVAIPPSLVINANPNDKSCEEGSPSLYGTTGHDIVKACPTVVRAIVAAVKSAAAQQSFSTTTTATSPNTAQSPEQQAQIAVVAHWLQLMNTTQSSQITKDEGQVTGKQAMRTTLLAGSGITPAQVIAASGQPSGSQPSFQFHYLYSAPQIVTAPDLPGGEGVTNGPVSVDGDIALRVIAVTASGGELSPAETANGVTFRGSVFIEIINRWRADAAHPYTPFTDYTYTTGVTLQNGRATFTPGEYEGAWVSGGFDGIEYPADVPISVACQLGATGQYPDFVGSNRQPPAGC